AAERIDKWFRSAKTLSDLPPLEEGDLAGKSSNEMVEPGHAGTAPIDFGGEKRPTRAESSSDPELESSADLPGDGAAWDDSQHMERLLADFENEPVDTFEPSAHEELPVAPESHDEQEEFHAGSDWTPDPSIAASATVGKPERKRSIVRTLVFSAVGGVL